MWLFSVYEPFCMSFMPLQYWYHVLVGGMYISHTVSNSGYLLSRRDVNKVAVWPNSNPLIIGFPYMFELQCSCRWMIMCMTCTLVIAAVTVLTATFFTFALYLAGQRRALLWLRQSHPNYLLSPVNIFTAIAIQLIVCHQSLCTYIVKKVPTPFISLYCTCYFQWNQCWFIVSWYWRSVWDSSSSSVPCYAEAWLHLCC